jgi:hypothetical protein
MAVPWRCYSTPAQPTISWTRWRQNRSDYDCNTIPASTWLWPMGTALTALGAAGTSTSRSVVSSSASTAMACPSGHTTWCSVSNGWNHYARSCSTSPSTPWRSSAMVIMCSGQLLTRHRKHHCCLPRVICCRSCYYTSTFSSPSQRAFRHREIAATISTYCRGLHQWQCGRIVTRTCKSMSWSGSARRCSAPT